MKPLKVLFLFFLRVTILGLNTAFIPLAQIGNASNFNDGYGLRLKLDEAVPFKVYSLNYPNRIVLELNTETHKNLNDFDIKSSPLLGEIKFKKLVDGWAAITIYIGKPAKVQNLTMKPHKLDASKVELSFELFPIVQYEFDRIVEIFSGTGSNEPAVTIENNFNNNKNNNLIVVIDPGHGGLDPGAQVKTIREADLMLSLAQVVVEEVQRLDHTEVILTRTSDQFVSLDKRLILAVQAGADVFISLHADFNLTLNLISSSIELFSFAISTLFDWMFLFTSLMILIFVSVAFKSSSSSFIPETIFSDLAVSLDIIVTL